MPIGTLHAETSVPASDMRLEIIQDTGIANRLAVGEVLRVLTQEVPAAACHLQAEINVVDATDLLQDGVAQVTELLDALVDGDVFWGIINPETRPKTIAMIGDLRKDWAPVQDASLRLLGDTSRQQDAVLIANTSAGLFDKSYTLLTTLDAQYSAGAEIQARDVMFIQISGRMTALNQSMALMACQLTSNTYHAEQATQLRQTIQDYEGSLQALSNGLPAMGILPPQTPGMADKLAEITAVWGQNKPLLALIAANEPLSEQQKLDLYCQLIDERVVLLDLLYLYQDHSKIMH